LKDKLILNLKFLSLTALIEGPGPCWIATLKPTKIQHLYPFSTALSKPHLSILS